MKKVGEVIDSSKRLGETSINENKKCTDRLRLTWVSDNGGYDNCLIGKGAHNMQNIL